MQQLSKGGQEDKYASKDKTTTAAAFMHAMSHIDGRRNEAVLYEPPVLLLSCCYVLLLCSAVFCCGVLCCAVLCCGVLCCVAPRSS